MAWPTRSTGYVVGMTNGDDTMHVGRPTVLATIDAGGTWTQYYPTDTTLSMNRIYFSSAQTGWASGITTTDQKSFLAKSTDGGKTWVVLDKSTSIIYAPISASNPISFNGDQHGLVLVQNSSDNS